MASFPYFSKRRRTMKLQRMVLPPFSMTSPTHPAMVLVRDLIHLSHQVSLCEKPQVCYRRYCSGLVRKVKLLGPLFEEVRDSNSPLPPSAVLAFRNLHGLLSKSKLLVEGCSQGSTTWGSLNSANLTQQFARLNEEMMSALKSIPLSLLEVSDEMKEHLMLLKVQSNRSSCCSVYDPSEEFLKVELRELLQAIGEEGMQEGFVMRLQKLFVELKLNDWADCKVELRRLREELRMSSTDAVASVELQSLIELVRSTARLLYGPEAVEDAESSCGEHQMIDVSQTYDDESLDDRCFPDEFRCPISLELMCNPVIIATGQTYDKEHIQKWIFSGHSTCPKSGQKLIHLNLIPNYALRSLIIQWCEDNDIHLDISDPQAGSFGENVMNSREALEVAKLTAAFLVGKLATGSIDVQKQVAYELRLLAKTGMENRICIAEAGAIPFLVPLLLSEDPKTQEDAVTSLLNLSIYDNNKKLIMAASALDPILVVLARGSSVEAKQNAAATIFSLSAVDEFRIEIGNRRAAIPALVKLLLEGSVQAKKDATSALFNLLLYPGNRGKAVSAGATEGLVEMLKEEEVSDDALAVLALIGESSEGLKAISDAAAIPKLVRLLRAGTVKGKENSLSVLLALCKHEGESIRGCVVGCDEVLERLHELVRSGTPRARRKARSLLKLLYNQTANLFVTSQS